ncbi:O-methyltransferase [Sphingosinicella sp. CPCC 101087]|uniref:O-methyltransferase n=1 Tax=Sphingosinicella sp. CPCC 101087 TaxID=2497754 RepID=UPI00101C74F8|nr:O-methyltransferase [Sphingosinicella sp. CPCC 101087]
MDSEEWSRVDAWFAERLLAGDGDHDRLLEANARAGLPEIDVSPLQGKFLHLLARAMGARRVLEIGTLGGYSTLWLARAVGPEGRVVTLEYEPRHAAVARSNLVRFGMNDRVDVRTGAALDLLPKVEARGHGPFDLVFIDADKANQDVYLAWALRLSRPGTAIIGDNVVRDGEVVDGDSVNPGVQGIRRFVDLLASEPRLSATAIQTVGAKGWDGFAFAVVE